MMKTFVTVWKHTDQIIGYENETHSPENGSSIILRKFISAHTYTSYNPGRQTLELTQFIYVNHVQERQGQHLNKF
jgi:hypothetical protein